MKIERPSKKAGGLKAVGVTAGFLRRETGLFRGGKAILRMNQPGGFDCPGCAWPEPADRARIEFCENGAKAFAEEATTKRASPEVFARHSIAELRAMSDYELGQLGRITHPMVLDGEHYRETTWEQAFALVGDALNGLDSPDQAIFYTSGRTSNEAAFLYQLFGRMFGTNNFPDCSNMCHESSGVGLSEVIGVGKGTVGLDDFEVADAVFVIGQNPGTNHPRMLSTLREAARRGCKIVSVNPLEEVGLVRFSHPQKVGDLVGGGTPLSCEYLQVKVGGDVALLQGIAKELLEREAAEPGSVLDRDFIDEHTTGFDAYREHIAAQSWDVICEESGIDKDGIRRAADLYAASDATIVCWAMGLTQHKNAVGNIQEIVNLLLLRGNLGRPGAGACPVRGHSNVQGDRTVGITHKPKKAFLDRLGAEFDFEPPREPGVDTVEAIHAMQGGRARVFVSMGGNFYSATPDQDAVGRGLAGLALTVHISTKVNRAHLYPGAASLILPCLGRTEVDEQADGAQFVTVEDSMSMVHASRGVLAPASEHLRSEPAIVAGIAAATLGVDWSPVIANYDLVRDHIERVVPGFEAYNQRVRSDDGFRLPNGARERDFAGIGGKARFTVHEIPRLALPEGKLRMMTMRSHDQYNTTIYGHDDRYRGVTGGRRVVYLNEDDIAALGLEASQVVDLVSEFEDEERVAEAFTVVPYRIPKGCAATYFPEANPLVPLRSVADKSNTPASKSVVIRIRPRSA